MLPLQFFGQNLHFAISLFTSLVFFAMFWLYIDAWSGSKKQSKDLWKWLGCLLLCLGFLLFGTVVEGTILSRPLLGSWASAAAAILQALGYAALIVGQITDPLQPVPHTAGLEGQTAGVEGNRVIGFGTLAVGGFKAMLPLGAGLTGWLYWRRATTGLERHLKPVAKGFWLLGLAALVNLSSLAAGSRDPVVYALAAPYGWLWWVSRLLLLFGSLVLARWVWQYLVKRIFSQIFMIFTAMVVAVFIVTTLSFSYLLVKSIQSDTLNSLENASNSLAYAVNGKQNQTQAAAEVLAANPAVAAAISSKDHDGLVKLTNGYLEKKVLASLVVAGSGGQVLLRAQDSGRWGDSVSNDPFLVRAAGGASTAGITSREDVLAPVLEFKASVPVKSGGRVVGVVMAGIAADTAFVDGVKAATGMDVAVYSGNVRSATTLLGPDGKSRLVGIKETDSRVKNQVLDKGKVFKGVISLLNQPYLAVYAPLVSYDNSIPGMLLVGRPHTFVLQTAGRSIELTFLAAALLIVLSVLPAYLSAKHIARQVR